MARKYLLPIAAFGWLVLCTALLTLPGKSFPTENWLDKIWFDKWVHIGIFCILAFLTCISWYVNKNGLPAKKLRNGFITIGALCLAYGIVMEFVQLYWTADRSFDMIDIAADGTGSAIGAIFSVKRYIKK